MRKRQIAKFKKLMTNRNCKILDRKYGLHTFYRKYEELNYE